MNMYSMVAHHKKLPVELEIQIRKVIYFCSRQSTFSTQLIDTVYRYTHHYKVYENNKLEKKCSVKQDLKMA